MKPAPRGAEEEPRVVHSLLPAGDLSPPGGKAARSGGNTDAEVHILHVPRPGSGVCAALSPSRTAFEMRSSSPRSQPVVSNA